MSRKLQMLAALLITVPVRSVLTRTIEVSLVAGLSACAPPTITLSAPPAAGIQAIPCVSLPIITYHAPKTVDDATKWQRGTLPDPSNRYDVPDTVYQIRGANAVIESLCKAHG